jgi:hypothetical protein
MDRCIRYADTNLIWTERLGRTSDQPAALGQSDKICGYRDRQTRACRCRLIYLQFSDAFYVIVAAISYKGDGG